MPSIRWLSVVALLGSTPVYASPVFLPWSAGLIFVGLALLLTGLGFYCIKLKRHNARLSQHSVRLHTVMQYTNDCIAILDQHKHIIYLNPCFTALGFSPTSNQSSLIPFYAEQYDGQLLLPLLQQHTEWSGEAWLQTADSALRQAYAVHIAPISADSDNYLLVARNIHSDKQRQQQSDLSYSHDNQTGLYSANILNEYLQSFVNFTNDYQPKFALVLVKFNQLLGADTGKPHILLQDILVELSEQVRQLCEKDYILARFSNDTIAIAIPPHRCGHALEVNLSRLSHKIIDLPTKLTNYDDITSIQPSVGISLYPQDGKNATELLLAASNAVSNAGRQGYNHLFFANAKIQQLAPEYVMLETELHKAVTQGEFDLYYQPRVSISSNRIIGYEALLRWHSPKRGIVLPQHFMHMADETGLLTQLDLLTFKKCCQQLKQWQQTGLARGRISLNVSSLSFRQNDFVSSLTKQLDKYELSAEQFELELQEDILLAEEALALNTLQQLAALGFHLTLDNFGVGVSSITALRKFPLHSVKIASSYIKDMEHDEQQRNITASIIRLASYLRLDAVATGIENEMQAYLLHVMGCDILQGHLFSKAIPAAEIPAVLAKENKLIRKEVG